MQDLASLIGELETKIPHFEKKNSALSASSAGWHIEHTLMASFSIIDSIKSSNPEAYKWKFKLNRMFVFAMNSIPRGKGRAPKAVQPTAAITAEKLAAGILLLKERIKDLDKLQPNHFFKHPYFDNLNLKATIKMLQIHTRHHINIIDDIIKAG